jgi:hypothetical protein
VEKHSKRISGKCWRRGNMEQVGRTLLRPIETQRNVSRFFQRRHRIREDVRKEKHGNRKEHEQQAEKASDGFTKRQDFQAVKADTREKSKVNILNGKY